jgi:hypothetical protein
MGVNCQSPRDQAAHLLHKWTGMHNLLWQRRFLMPPIPNLIAIQDHARLVTALLSRGGISTGSTREYSLLYGGTIHSNRYYMITSPC